MMVENLSGIVPYHNQEYRTEKKTELETVRPVEESGDGHLAELDIDKQDVTGSQLAKAPDNGPEPLTYNEKGLVDQGPAPDAETPGNPSNVDLIV